ncbi:MAG: hypothetical protein KC652_19670 [Cyanobacteria bacterium HKST-UBA01]|nr:hypothetical protein [Cyanobacteria bacterium HKST-UBA01]
MELCNEKDGGIPQVSDATTDEDYAQRINPLNNQLIIFAGSSFQAILPWGDSGNLIK